MVDKDTPAEIHDQLYQFSILKHLRGSALWSHIGVGEKGGNLSTFSPIRTGSLYLKKPQERQGHLALDELGRRNFLPDERHSLVKAINKGLTDH